MAVFNFIQNSCLAKKMFILHVVFIPDVTNKDLSIIIIKAVSWLPFLGQADCYTVCPQTYRICNLEK